MTYFRPSVAAIRGHSYGALMANVPDDGLQPLRGGMTPLGSRHVRTAAYDSQRDR